MDIEVISGIIIAMAGVIISYTYSKRKRLDMEAKLESNLGSQPLMDERMEMERRAKITQKIDSFLKHSKFIEHIANWRNEKIYKYIFNNGYLYEFEEIMSENQQSIGMDEELLCFNQLCYRRVTNPSFFMEKFASQLK